MVEFAIADTKIKISFLFVSLLSLLSLLDRSGSIFLSVIFSFLHELGHIIAVTICKGRIDELCFHPYGIAMKLSAVFTPLEELFVLVSGCAVNLIFLPFSNGIIYYINLAMFLFNTLPIGSLDGGRVLQMLLSRLFGDRASTITLIISFLLLLPLSSVGFYLAITTKQPTLLVCSLYLATTMIIKREKLF